MKALVDRNLAVMATGGIDSTTILYMQVHGRRYRKVVALYIDYGQTVRDIEISNLKYHCRNLGIDIIVLEMAFQEGTHGLTDANFVPSIVHDQDDPAYWNDTRPRYHDTHIEGRNSLMFLTAIAWCAKNGYDELQTGMYFCEREWKHQHSVKMLTADNSPGFIYAINTLAQFGFSRRVSVSAPFFDSGINKLGIIQLATAYSVPLEKTHSCYFPTPCGKCDNCISRKNKGLKP